MNQGSGHIIVSLLVFASAINPLAAQPTAFTYQGRLQNGATSANGSYDLTFSLWTTSTGPSQVGGTITNSGTTVSNGLFTVMMDFGGVFDGNPRWLEIAVRTNGNEAFTTLSPRQALTATPYAIYAGGVNAAGISGSIPPGNIASATITSNMLAPGAAAANLAASGQSFVPSGGMVLSGSANDPNLMATGFARVGGYINAPNLWRELSLNASLSGRAGHAAIWTGSRMVIWGGYCGNENPDLPPPIVYFNDAASYDPADNSWSIMGTNGAPAGRKAFSSVWTGSEMIIWSGYTYDSSYHYFADGALFNPTTQSWNDVTTNNAPAARSQNTAVWTGTEMIVWGGFCGVGSGFQYSVLADGGRYNPVSNTWVPVSNNGAPKARFRHTAVWTGSEMLVWGGQDGSWLNDGKRYNPATDTWSPMSSTGAPSSRCDHTAVWTGSEMIIWGGRATGGPYLTDGGRYNPATDSWKPTDYASAPSPRLRHTAVWTGREMIIWGGECGTPLNDGGSYDPASNTWMPMATAPRAPAGRENHTAIWTGNEMIIFGGSPCLSDAWSCAPPKLLYLYQRP